VAPWMVSLGYTAHLNLGLRPQYIYGLPFSYKNITLFEARQNYQTDYWIFLKSLILYSGPHTPN
jgi:hypothetical protein